MKIMNTVFQKSQKRQWTWKSPDGGTFNQIDYVLCNVSRIISDVSVIGEKIIYTGSDHTWATPPHPPPIWGGIARLAKDSAGRGPKTKSVKSEKNCEKVKEKCRKTRKKRK